MTRCDPQRLSHQTVRLTRGPNSSPDEGVCVMELASMLAGEPFCDRPSGVSAVITGVLRTHNDRIDDRRRQDLYRYAAQVVGTGGDAEAERARAKRCLEWEATSAGVGRGRRGGPSGSRRSWGTPSASRRTSAPRRRGACRATTGVTDGSSASWTSSCRRAAVPTGPARARDAVDPMGRKCG